MTTSESIYKLIVENALTSILLSKPDGTILEANKAACDLFQYTRDELRQVGKKGIIDHSESNAPEKPEERKKDGKATGELTGIKKNGEHFPIEFSSVIFYDNNGDEVNCTTINDISERKKAEQEIAFLINNTSESYILLDKQLNIVSFNRQFQESYKKYFKQDIVKGKWIVDYAQPERKEAVKAIYKRVLQGTNEEYELIIPVQDGPEKIYSLRYHAAKDEKDVIIGVFVTATDITEERELKRKEDTLLKQSEQHNSFIETILQNLPIGIAVNNTKDGKATVINKSFSDIYGWDNEEISEVNTFFEKVYPDEIYREEIKQQVMADIESGDPEKMTWKNIMITTKAGKTRIINAKNIPLPEQGLMISTVVDVTNEFRHNAEINRTKIKQEALINGTTDLIWSVDANFCVITANNAYLEMMKMATNRLIVEGDKVLVPEFGEALNQKWESYYRRTLQGERFSIKEEVYNTVKKQMEYGKVSFNPVRNKAGEIFGIACFSKNITEETINLLALEKTKAELNKIMDSSMDMICAVDANGYFKKVSAACIHILGYKPEEMIEKHINDFIVAEDQERTILKTAT
jgi:PAS domain S-box-containing protein